MIIIGEKINSSIKNINDAIINKDDDAIMNIAKLQEEAGADYIDVNAGTFLKEESEKLVWLIKAIRKITNKPLVIDSPNPDALISALEVYTGPTPIINSITLEAKRFEPVLNIVKKYNTNVIALCMDDSGIPESTDKRVEIATKLIEQLNKNGIENDSIFLDPLIKPLATSNEDTMSSLEAIAILRESFPDVHIVCGLSNISYGLPARRTINSAFLIAAMVKGLDSAIMDPLDDQLMDLYYATNALLGNDEYCMEYLTQYRERGFK